MKSPFPNQVKIISFQIVTNHLLMIPGDFVAFYPLEKGLVRKNHFREDLIPSKGRNLIFQMNLFLTIAFWYPLYHEFFTSFTKMKPCNPVGWALAHQIFLQRGHGGASPTLLALIKSGSLSHLSLPYPARLQKQFCEALFNVNVS